MKVATITQMYKEMVATCETAMTSLADKKSELEQLSQKHDNFLRQYNNMTDDRNLWKDRHDTASSEYRSLKQKVTELIDENTILKSSANNGHPSHLSQENLIAQNTELAQKIADLVQRNASLVVENIQLKAEISSSPSPNYS